MRNLTILLLLPTVVLAQQPGPAVQMDPQQAFEQNKKIQLPMIEERLPLLRKARSCLQAAENRDDFLACSEIVVELNNKRSAQMGQSLGMPEGQKPPKWDPQEIEWNEETKKHMLISLDSSILVSSAMLECFNQSSEAVQMLQCMQAKKPKP